MPRATTFVSLNGTSTLHHVGEPKPLRGEPAEVKTLCGRRGKPTLIERGRDSRAERIGKHLVCVSCFERNALNEGRAL